MPHVFCELYKLCIDFAVGKDTASANVEEHTKEDAHSVETHIGTTADIGEDIKSKFLVAMPEDFFQFWDFAKSLHPKNPQGQFVKLIIIWLKCVNDCKHI